MFRLPVRRGLPRRVGPLLVLVLSGWGMGSVVGCRVDESGLGSTPKLSRDAGSGVGTGGQATGGASGLGGSGTGGEVIATGGSGGGPSGSGGVTSTGGTGDSTGGSVGAGGGIADAGVTGAAGSGGAAGVMGTGGGAGSPATGGQAGGGAAGSGGMAGGAGRGAAGSSGGAGHGGTGGTRCTSLNCMGCCAGNVCVPMPTAQQCGTHGAACTACPRCQTCSAAGACVISPSSQWTIVAESAQVTTAPPFGSTWDPPHGDEGGTAPDLFCEYENPAYTVTPTTAGVTPTVVDVYSAVWDDTITPAGVTVSASALMAAKPAWRIWVGDEDCSTPNNCGSGQIACSYSQPISAASLMNGGLTISNYQNCVSLNLLFECASPAP